MKDLRTFTETLKTTMIMSNNIGILYPPLLMLGLWLAYKATPKKYK
jgi:hypothetical protein